MSNLQFTKINKILLLTLAFWLALAFSRTLYNLTKLYTEEKEWYGLTNEEKREKFFGDTHYFLRFLDSHTANKSSILLYTNDLKVHYLGRYYLYPSKKIIGKHDSFHWFPEKNIYDYIVIYPVSTDLTEKAEKTSNIKAYKEYATYNGKDGQTGIIYKK